MLPKTPDCSKPRAKLAEERRPSDLDILFQGMEAVSKPDIDIDHHRAGAYCPERALANRNWVFTEGAEKVLIQENPVLPKSRLVSHHVRHSDFGLHEPAAALDLCAVAVCEKCKSASRNGVRLNKRPESPIGGDALALW